ncbi:hypothetical protein D3C73_973090 [compost metagenome]
MAHSESARAECAQQHPPPRLQPLRQVDDHQGEGRQFSAKTLEYRLELRHHLDQQDSAHDDRHAHDDQRVGHGFLDLGLEAFAFFLVGRHPFQQGVQRAGLFPGVHQVAVQLVEILRFLAQGAGEAVARRYILFHLVDQLAHGRVIEAFTDDVEGLQQRHAGFHHGRHLPGEKGYVLGLDALAHVENRRGLPAHLAGFDTLFAQLRLDQRRVLAAQLARYLRAFPVCAFPAVDAGACCLDCHVQPFVTADALIAADRLIDRECADAFLGKRLIA